MVQLEAVYLANVILYIKSIETIIKLIQISKRCQEATKIIRYYDTRKLFESDDEFPRSYCIVKNVFELFPNIETISCSEDDIKNNFEVIERVKQIELIYFGDMYFPQEIMDKIIKLEIRCDSLEDIPLNLLPNVKKVKIDTNCYFSIRLKEFLGNKELKLKQLIIKMRDTKEFDCLNEFKNIENKMIIINDQISKERYKELRQYSKVYSIFPIEGIDIKETFVSLDYLRISKGCDINRLYDLTLFTKNFVESDSDLRHCELLEEVGVSLFDDNKVSVRIEGLNNLKTITLINKLDCVPSSVTYLSFYPSFNYKELSEKDINCFYNIKQVKLYVKENDKLEDSKLFLRFKNCTKIDIINMSESICSFEFPLYVKELGTIHSIDIFQINQINKLTNLKKLTNYVHIHKKFKNQIQEMYDNLKEIEWLKTNPINGIQYPSSLTFLSLIVDKNIDLSHQTNLKEIRLICESNHIGFAKLPAKFDTLYVEGCIFVSNSKELKVGKVILNETLAQDCEWQTTNIVVLKNFNESSSEEHYGFTDDSDDYYE